MVCFFVVTLSACTMHIFCPCPLGRRDAIPAKRARLRSLLCWYICMAMATAQLSVYLRPKYRAVVCARRVIEDPNSEIQQFTINRFDAGVFSGLSGSVAPSTQHPLEATDSLRDSENDHIMSSDNQYCKCVRNFTCGKAIGRSAPTAHGRRTTADAGRRVTYVRA